MTVSNKVIPPYSIQQAVVAVKLGDTDDELVSYLDFFTKQVPITSAQFLHVLPTFDLFNTLFRKEGRGMVSNFELNEEAIREMQAATKAELSKQNIKKVDFDVREGNPLEQLLKEVEETNADLVIIGQASAHGAHGILARNLVRKIACDALIVPEKSRERLHKIVVPIDFSETSIKAFKTAVGISQQLAQPAEIVCLNIYEMPSVAAIYIGKTTEQLKEIIEKDRMESFRDFLESYGAKEAAHIKTVLIENKVGDIGTYIMDFAQDLSADLIVIGAKGHSSVERLLLGSVTERLLSENESIPTFVVK